MTKKKNIKNTEKVTRSIKPVITPNWTATEGLTPFYDSANKRYSVAVSLKYEKVGPNFHKAYPSEYVEEGIKKILSYYNKKTPNDLASLLNIGEANEYYVPPRPRAKIKALISVSDKKFDELSENDFDGSSASREINLNTYNLTKKIKGITDLLENFHQQIKKLDGRIYGIDLEDEATDLKNFTSAMEMLVRNNGYLYDESISDILAVGVDDDYNAVYAQINKGEKFENLVRNFGKFKQSPSIKNNQSLYYLSKMEEIYGASKSTPPMNWEKFLGDFTIKKYRIDLNVKSRNYVGAKNKTIGGWEQELDKQNRKGWMTQDEYDEETANTRDNPMLRKNLMKARDKARDNIEQGALGNLKKVENALDGMESSYYQFLHKYQVVPLVRQAIICVDPTGQIARTYTQMKQYLRDANKFLEEVIEILKIPLLKLPDWSVTVNIMGDIGEKIWDAILETIKITAIQLLKDVIQMLIESCGNPDNMNFGGVPLKDLFTDPNVVGDLLKGPLLDRGKTALLDGLEKGVTNIAMFELDASREMVKGISGFLGNETVQRLMDDGFLLAGGAMSHFLDEVGLICTPGELGHLLTNGGTPEIKTTIHNLISESDRFPPEMKDLFKDEGGVEDFFKSAGGLLDHESLFETIAKASNRKMEVDGSLGPCDRNINNDARRLLMDKGLSGDEAEKQINDAQQRHAQRLKDLADALEKDNLLNDAMPPTYCSVDENGNVIPGMLDIDHDSFTHMLKRTVNTTYDNIHTTFNEDVLGYVPALKSDTPQEPLEVKRVKLKQNRNAIMNANAAALAEDPPGTTIPIYMINPQFQMYHGMGYTSQVDFPYPYSIDLNPKGDVINTTGRSTGATTARGITMETMQARQLSPDPDKEAIVAAISGSATSIFVPRVIKTLVPGLQNNLKNLSLTGSLAESNFQFQNNRVLLKQPNFLVQTLDLYGNTDDGKSLKENMKIAAAEEGVSNFSFGPNEWVVSYEAGRAAPGQEYYNFNVIAIEAAGSLVGNLTLFNDSSTIPINAKALRVIESKNLSDQVQAGAGKSPQEQRFCDLLDKTFKNGCIARKTDNFTSSEQVGGTGFSIIETLFSHQVPGEIDSIYAEIFRDFFTTFSSEISRSDFFIEKNINLANFVPRLTREQIQQGCRDPHLLDLETIKEIIINQYNITKCVEKNQPNEDGLGTSRNNALESAITSGAAIVIIRLYAIEAILKSIWAFSEFKFTRPADVDQTLISFIKTKMMKEIGDKRYLNDFLLECFRTYNRIANLTPDDDRFFTTNQEVALEHLIRQEVFSVIKKVDVLLDTTHNNTIDSVVSDTFIPTYDVAKGPGELRLKLKDVKALSDINNYEHLLISQGLTEDDISKRRGMQWPGSLITLGHVIHHLGSSNMPNYPNSPFDLGWTLKAQFEGLPLPSYPSELWPDWSYPSALPPQPGPAGSVSGQSTSTNPNIPIGGTGPLFPLGWSQPSRAPAPGLAAGASQEIQDLQPLFRLVTTEDRANTVYHAPPGSPRDTALQRLLPLSGSNVEDRTSWFNELLNPRIHDREWQSSGLKNPGLWRTDISNFEKNAVYTLFELFNEPNVLMPGNAGSSFTVPRPDYDTHKYIWSYTYRAQGQVPRSRQELYSDGIDRIGRMTPRYSMLSFKNLGITLPLYDGQPRFKGRKKYVSRSDMNVGRLEHGGVGGGAQLWDAVRPWKNSYEDRPEHRRYADPGMGFYSRDGEIQFGERSATRGVGSGRNPDYVPPERGPAAAGSGGGGGGGPRGNQPQRRRIVEEGMYNIIDLPSSLYAYTPVSFLGPEKLWNPSPWSEPYHTLARTTPGAGAWGGQNLDPNASAETNAATKIGHRYNGTHPLPAAYFKWFEYRPVRQSALPWPSNAHFPDTNDITKDSFVPSMMQFNIFDATIENLPAVIEMDKRYYESWHGMTDEQLYLNIKRQFKCNRIHWALSYSERKKLDKVGQDFLNGRWNNRELPTVAELESVVEKHNDRMTAPNGRMWGAATLTFLAHQVKVRLKNLQLPNPYLVPCVYGTFSMDNYDGAGWFTDLEDGWPVGPKSWSATRPHHLPTGQQITLQAPFLRPLTVPGGAWSQYEKSRDFPIPMLSDELEWELPNQQFTHGIGHRGSNFQNPWALPGAPLNPSTPPGTISWPFPGAGSAGARIVQDAGKSFYTLFEEMKSLRTYNNAGGVTYGPISPETGEPYFDGTNFSHMSYMQTYFLLWELDWWLSKLTAFMLLSPDFEDHRDLKDYPAFLGGLEDIAVYIQEQFKKDLLARETRREEILDAIGGLKNLRVNTGKPLTHFLGNGNLIYEMYIKTKDKSPQKLRVDLRGKFGGGPGAGGASAAEQAIIRILNDRTGWQKDVINIDLFAEWLFDNFSGIKGIGDVEFTLPGTPLLIEAVATEEECGEDLIFRTPEVPERVLKGKFNLNDLFEEVSLGFRLTCVGTPNGEHPASALFNKVLSQLSFGGSQTFNIPIPPAVAPFVSNETVVIPNWAMRDKAYLMREKAWFNTGGPLATELVESDYVTIPISCVEEKLDMTANILEFIGNRTHPVLQVTKPKLRWIYDGRLSGARTTSPAIVDPTAPNLSTYMRQSDEFKFVFKYAFPVDRMFSLVSMYIATYMASFEQTTGLFNNTKESLRIIFMAMINSGNYLYEDELQNATLANAEMGGSDGMNQTPGVDLKALAIKFPFMILKGLTETFDPNIAVAKKIQLAANSGIRAANDFVGGFDATRCSGIRIPEIPVLPISMALLPINLFGIPPAGIGIGPPITPLGMFYLNAFGFYDWLEADSNRDATDSKRCNERDGGGRDFTNIVTCNTEPIDTSAYVGEGEEDEEE